MEFRRYGKAGNVMAFGLVLKGLAAAHIKDARLAYEAVDLLCNKFWTPGLVSTHNAGGGFNLDISGGMPALIAEMLMQSAPGRIELLPVLPEAWPDGRVQGLRARGGFEVDIEWKDGSLVSATVKSLLGKPCRVHYHKRVEIASEFRQSDNRLTISVREPVQVNAGEQLSVELRFDP
jgi:hypothetical protein